MNAVAEQQAQAAAVELVRIYRHSRFALSEEFLDDLLAELTRFGRAAYSNGATDAVTAVAESFHRYKALGRQAEFDEADIRGALKEKTSCTRL